LPQSNNYLTLISKHSFFLSQFQTKDAAVRVFGSDCLVTLKESYDSALLFIEMLHIKCVFHRHTFCNSWSWMCRNVCHLCNLVFAPCW